MATLEIFRLRQLLDKQRQPSLRSTLELLIDALTRISKPHPYKLSWTSRESLAATAAAFSSGADEWTATTTSTHLFRLCTIGALVRGTGWRFHTNDSTAFDTVYARHHTSGQDWIPLSWFANGVLQNSRGFTWWSTLDLTGPDPWNLWRRVGLLDTSIAHDCLILRCNVDAARAMVPTCVDGFDEPVFESVHDEPTPSHGRAIDLSARPLGPGAAEYVVPALPTPAVEVRPLLVTKDMKRQGNPTADSPATWKLLETYYRGLIIQ